MPSAGLDDMIGAVVVGTLGCMGDVRQHLVAGIGVEQVVPARCNDQPLSLFGF